MGAVEVIRNSGGHVFWRMLDAARGRWRGVLAAEGALRALLALLGGVVVAVAADNLFHLPGWTRLAVALALLAGVLWLVARRVVWPLVMPITDEMTAVHIEKALPGLDNRIINAVQLSEELDGMDGLSQDLAIRQIDESVKVAAGIPISHTTSARPLRKWAIWVGVAVVVLGLYGAFRGQYLLNALVRYRSPLAYHPPITRTHLAVSPGNTECVEGERLSIEARCQGLIPDRADLLFRFEGDRETRRSMPFEGDRFVHMFESVQRPFSYRVRAGDAESPIYNVVVRRRPRIEALTLSYKFPAYMGMEPRTEEKASGNIVAPVGTEVAIALTADRPINRAWAEVKWVVMTEEEGKTVDENVVFKPQGAAASGTLTVARSGQYRIFVEDTGLVRNQPVACQIVAQPDSAPVVTVTSPGKNITAPPGAKVNVLAKAEDDFGVRRLELMVQRDANEGFKPAAHWDYGSGKKMVNEGSVIDLAAMKAGTGDVIVYYFRAEDGMKRPDAEAGRSAAYQITVVAAQAQAAADKESFERLRDAVKRMIAAQTANIKETETAARFPKDRLKDIADEPAHRRLFQLMVTPLVNRETGLYNDAMRTVETLQGRGEADLLTELSAIAATDVTEAVRKLKELEGAARNADIPVLADASLAAEKRVLTRLEKLLARLEVAEKTAATQEAAREELAGEEPETTRDKVKALLKKIEEFKDEQKEAVALSQRLAEKEAQDFSAEDKRDLENVINTEEKWAKIFQEKATDLSKLPEQDFSVATQAKELVEQFTELPKKLTDAAEKAQKNVEIAVPVEEAGLELAKSIETNLEKWLAEAPDNIKWSMEDPTQENQTPMVELPEELEDIVGDLIDNVDKMDEETEDVTSGWLDSMDKGAGWGALDGPISNMSAKGVTGNLMPNQQEVGGRSGEGRTGKSSGQFVEQEATGKGGRDTPTRMTADPFEAGMVKDTAPEAATGSTGGGKQSGQGQEGLRGPVPPAVKEQLKRIAARQQQLIEKAERLDFGLDKYKYPRGELPDTIKMMQELKGAAERGEYRDYAKVNKVILTNLREVKGLVVQQKQLNRDRSAQIPKEMRDEIAAGLKEKTPKEYRDLVEEYFKSLSQTPETR